MLTAKLQNIKSYLLAGKLLHIISLIEILVIAIIIPLILELETTTWSHFVIKYYSIIFFTSLPVFSQFDAYSRFQNYKQIKDQLFIYGFDKRIFKPVLKSRCQRDAALLSAHELEMGNECREYFWLHGYRWYHLTPDFLFTKPQFLLTKYFWKTTFFTPTYHSRVKYSGKQATIINPKPYIRTNGKHATC